MTIETEFVDRVAQGALEAFGAPGLSIAIFADGKIVSRGYGIADADTGDPVSGETAFSVASSTKSFTALALAILREEGALDWDDPVARLAPDLCEGRGGQSSPITVRDILCHQAGFGWHDPLWYNSPWDRDTVIRKAWQAGPAREPRSAFQYCNLMYMLAGEIVARASGSPYETFVRRRILEPLGLSSAHFSNEPVPAGFRLAQPHARPDGELRRLETPDVGKANAACGLRMSAWDLAVWMSQYCGAGGTAIPVRTFESVTEPQVAIGPGEGARFYTLFGQPDWLEYGMGWFLRRYRGHRVVFHTGRLPGSGAHVAILPGLGFGVAALTNLTFSCLAETIVSAVLERLTGGPATDWVSYYRRVSTELAALASPPPASRGDSDGAGAPPLDDCRLGGYVEPAYGRLEIRKRPHGLKLAWANYRGDLIHRSGGTYSVVNLGCPLLSDGESLEFCESSGAVLFLGRRFERAAAARPGRRPGVRAASKIPFRRHAITSAERPDQAAVAG